MLSTSRVLGAVAAALAAATLVALFATDGSGASKSLKATAGSPTHPRIHLSAYVSDTPDQQAEALSAAQTLSVDSVPTTDGSDVPQDPSTVTVNSNGFADDTATVASAATTRDVALTDFFPNDSPDTETPDTQPVVVVRMVGTFMLDPNSAPHPPGKQLMNTGNQITMVLDASGNVLDFQIEQVGTPDPSAGGGLAQIYTSPAISTHGPGPSS